MEPDLSRLFLIMALFILLDLVMLSVLLINKFHYRRSYRERVRLSGIINDHLFSMSDGAELVRLFRKKTMLFLQTLKDLGDSVELPVEMKRRWVEILRVEGIIDTMYRRLGSRRPLSRLEAATGLGVLGGEEANEGLLNRLTKEPKWHLKLIIIQILTYHEYVTALPEIFRVLRDAPKWVRQKCFSVLPRYGEALERYVGMVVEKQEEKDLDLLFELGERYSCEALNGFLVESLRGDHATMARRAAESLEQQNPTELHGSEFIFHHDEVIRASAARSLRWKPDEASLALLFDLVADKVRSVRRPAVLAIQEIVSAEPQFLDDVVEEFHKTAGTVKRRNLARVLEARIEYFLYRVNSGKYPTVKELIYELAGMRRMSVVFGFLERNSILEIEDAILDIIAEIAVEDSEVGDLCARYLPGRMLEKLDIEKREIPSTKESVPLKKGDRRLLVAIFAAILLSGPVIYAAHMWGQLEAIGGAFAHLTGFSELYTYVFAFYCSAINTIYLLLLIFAVIHLTHQHRYWKASSYHLLFSKELLPSISVLAPAYNEELSIVDNVKSLININYPDVEVIVINDGSKDGTINRLIESFELERVDREGKAHIDTEPVRGIYVSRSYPNLTVVDKVNGGKADSLNAGINLASKDFICTIDSDSLLEHDALLKAAYHTILSDREPIALGGNIIPANGCTIRNGTPVKIALSKDHLSRFQTIEYMRAFLAGRLGWSLINSMVIISGAFGLFIRKRVVEVGGYLTPKSRYHASTVGEDMELVVRLHEHMRNKKLPYKVYDAFNANCWTEVPDSFRILHRQRDRWHRGLIETVLFHKRMTFNPKYGPVGTVAFPYFLLFELIGPFFELFGYLNLFISIALGLITAPVAAILFITVILYGILISLGSLLISENEILYFNVPETLKIILYAFLENFGFRQVMSAIRVTAYVSFLFKEKSWGVMERKGFSKRAQ